MPSPREATDRVGDVVGVSVLEDGTAGAGFEGAEHVLFEVEGGDDEDGGQVAAALSDDLPGRGQAVAAGHAHVHADDVGTRTAHHRHRLRTARRPTDDLDVPGVLSPSCTTVTVAPAILLSSKAAGSVSSSQAPTVGLPAG